ncbi:MAG: hypothetical protein KAR42_16910 [candidate division Zixibacteria bacterium]|nr:hypothetical protein [candidate division Zixibacteria bacterium]
MIGISKYKNERLIRMKSLIEEKLSIKLDDDGFKKIMNKYIEIVTPPSYLLTRKERRILNARLNQCTLESIGKMFKRSKENIRQGQDKALRKMMHPRLMNMLLEKMKEEK